LLRTKFKDFSGTFKDKHPDFKYHLSTPLKGINNSAILINAGASKGIHSDTKCNFAEILGGGKN